MNKRDNIVEMVIWIIIAFILAMAMLAANVFINMIGNS